jgi:SHS2 domain-containing protein
MKKYELLEHKADLKVKFFGKDKKELIKNATEGMFFLAGYETVESEKEFSRKICLSSFDFDSLFIDFLNKLIYFCEAKKVVYYNVEILELSDKKIVAILKGKKIKNMKINIKAATYYNVKLLKKGNIFEIVVVFDV